MAMSDSGGNVWEDVAPLEERTLSGEHQRLLMEESGIHPDVIAGRGYHSLRSGQINELVNLGVLTTASLSATGWLSIPIYRPDGSKHGEQIRVFGSMARQKYLWPSGARLAFDVHPSCLGDLFDPDVPILITEGTKKADALLSAARAEHYRCVVIALAGCLGWRARINDATMASPDFLDVVWENRKVFVISDSDFRSNDEVARGWTDAAYYITGKTGPHRTFLVIVPPAGTTKQGADDYLVAGHSLDDLLGLAQTPRFVAMDTVPETRPLRVDAGGSLMRAAPPKIPYLMAPLIPAGSIMLVAGHSGTLKTWAAIALALDGAMGLPWLDHPELRLDLGPFTTLYVNKEMQRDIVIDRLLKYGANDRYNRISDWRDRLDRFQLVSEAALDLALERDRDRLEEAILASGAKLVVLDSLSMSWGGDENSASEVGRFYSQLRDITERTGCAWILIHHLLKTGAIKKGDPLTLAIRGSGQLSQQADVAVMFANYASEQDSPSDGRLISMTHAKARTDRELQAWLTKFNVPDGLYAHYRYLGPLTEAKARAASTSPAASGRIKDWILEELRAMPAMKHTQSGLRFRLLVPLLQGNWSSDDKSPPSDDTIRRHLLTLVEEGQLTVLEESRRFGHLFRLADPEETPDDRALPPSTAATVSPAAVDPASKAGHADEADEADDLDF